MAQDRDSTDDTQYLDRRMPRSTVDPNDPAVKAFTQDLEETHVEQELEVSPVSGPTDFGDVALSLFDSTKDMIEKTRLEKRKRSLYTRAIVVAKNYDLNAILQYVYMDLKLMIPEDGKRIKEFLIPFENLLRDRTKAAMNANRPEI